MADQGEAPPSAVVQVLINFAFAAGPALFLTFFWCTYVAAFVRPNNCQYLSAFTDADLPNNLPFDERFKFDIIHKDGKRDVYPSRWAWYNNGTPVSQKLGGLTAGLITNPAWMALMMRATINAMKDVENKGPALRAVNICAFCAPWFMINGIEQVQRTTSLTLDDIGGQFMLITYCSVGWTLRHIYKKYGIMTGGKTIYGYVHGFYMYGLGFAAMFGMTLGEIGSTATDQVNLSIVVLISTIQELLFGYFLRPVIRNLNFDMVDAKLLASRNTACLATNYLFMKRICVLRLSDPLFVGLAGPVAFLTEVFLRTTGAKRDRFYAAVRGKRDDRIFGNMHNDAKEALCLLETVSASIETAVVLPISVNFMIQNHITGTGDTVPSLALRIGNMLYNYMTEFAADLVVVTFGPPKPYGPTIEYIKADYISVMAPATGVAWFSTWGWICHLSRWGLLRRDPSICATVYAPAGFEKDTLPDHRP